MIHAIEIVHVPSARESGSCWSHLSIETSGDSVFVDRVHVFSLNTLEWAKYPDCAPAVGRFLLAFFRSLDEEEDETASRSYTDQRLPLWISPVKQFLERHIDLLEVLENHVIPHLIRISHADLTAFLGTLPIDDIQNGCVGGYTNADIQLCLLVARVNFVSKPAAVSKSSHDPTMTHVNTKTLHEYSIGDKIEMDKNGLTKIDSLSLAIGLLEHFSADIRIPALSLLVSSLSIPLFSVEVLHRLQVSLPAFHVEVNPKSRNEFIALMKKLFLKLRIPSTQSTKNKFQPSTEECAVSTFSNGKANEDDAAVLGNPQAHDFKLWYMDFLLHQLRPTASYQSHITALRLLHPLLGQELSVRPSLFRASAENTKSLAEGFSRRLLLRPLLELLSDAFDDVRQAANMAFETLLSSDQVSSSSKPREKADAEDGDDELTVARERISVLLGRAEQQAANSGRAHHADGVGRLYSILYLLSEYEGQSTAWYSNPVTILEYLMFRLEKDALCAKESLPLAVSKASLHGRLIAFRSATYFRTSET